jgi:hypothetical protein
VNSVSIKSLMRGEGCIDRNGRLADGIPGGWHYHGRSMLGSLKVFWFFLWRMILWGLALGVLAGAAYAAGTLMLMLVVSIETVLSTEAPSASEVFAGLVYWVVSLGVMFGFLGAIVGLPLGLLCGLLVFALTRAFHWPQPTDPDGYRRAAGLMCALGSGLLLLTYLERVSKPPHWQLAWQQRKSDWPIDRRSCLVGVRHARRG